MARNPDYEGLVRSIFARAPFMQTLGIVVDNVSEGRVDTSMQIETRHLQQNGFAHAGVVATIADHSAGGAAITMVSAGQGVLTIEFKINLLRPAQGQRLECIATVLKAGKTVSICESEVFAIDGASRVLAAKATVTLAVVPFQ